MNTRLVLLLAFVLACAFATNTITLKGLVRDFKPVDKDAVLGNPDFQRLIRTEYGLLQDTLDANDKPILKDPHPAGGTITNQQYFSKWYRDDSSNIPFEIEITLTEGANGVYTYVNNNFFPINGKGWGDYSNNKNYHFTTEIKTTFTYLGTETFTFAGDDDVWVFINRKLAVDIGGVHGSITKSVYLPDIADFLGIEVGKSYPLDFFHAERHTTESNFRIDTTLQLVAVDPVETNPGVEVAICQVPVLICANSAVNCPTKAEFSLAGGKYSTSNFNAISFNSFVANTGDVEGRLAVRNDYTVGSGYTIGFELITAGAFKLDESLPWSLLVGRNGVWPSGSIHPAAPSISPAEELFVGGTFTTNVNSGLAEKRNGPCIVPGCYNAEFDVAKSYYETVQDAFAALTPNTVATKEWSNLKVECNPGSISRYVVNVAEADFNSITTWSFVGCNNASSYVFNILGSGTVFFRGLAPAIAPEQVVWNVLGSGRTIDVTGIRVEGSIIAPRNTLYQTGGVIVGQVIVGDATSVLQINRLKCGTPSDVVVEPVANCAFEGPCTGLAFPLKNGVYSFKDFNAIAFGNFDASTGDVEGRLAVKGNLNLGNGYSIGDKLKTASGPDNSLPYSLVVGGNAVYGSGEVFPLGDSTSGPREDIFVGGQFTSTSQNLIDRVTGNCQGNTGCLNAYFNAAKGCYEGFQSNYAGKTANAVASSFESALHVTCNSNSAVEHVVTVTTDLLDASTYWVLHNCNLAANWVINIPGTGAVNFKGDSFPANALGVVYNIQGSGRTINVQTQVNGNVLAPNNDIVQTGGVIIGKTVARNIVALQINHLVCTDVEEVALAVPVKATNNGENKVPVEDPSNCNEGDKIKIGNDHSTIKGIHQGPNKQFYFELEDNLTADRDATVATVTVSNPAAYRSQAYQVDPSDSTSSATTVSAFFALIVALIALLV